MKRQHLRERVRAVLREGKTVAVVCYLDNAELTKTFFREDLTDEEQSRLQFVILGEKR